MRTYVRNEITTNNNIEREDAYKANFINACFKESNDMNICTCLYQYVVDNYDWDERMILDREVEQGRGADVINAAVQKCTSSYVQ